MYNEEEEKDKMFPGNSGNEYNFNYNAGAVNSGYYGQQESQQPQQTPFQQQGYSTSGNPSAGFSTSNAFDNVDISRNGNRFSSGTPFETVQEFVSVSNKVRRRFLCEFIQFIIFTFL